MAINYEYKIEQKTLKVLSKGKDEDLKEVENYAREILEIALKNDCTMVLCDERQLEYSLSVLDTYTLAEGASKEARALRKIAIVCNKKFLEYGKFYETVSQNRGLVVLATSDYDQATEWLNR